MENRSIVRKTVVLIRAQLTAWVVTALLLLLMALLLFKLELNESKVSLGMNAVYVLSCFFGGLAAGKGGKKRKFLWDVYKRQGPASLLFCPSLQMEPFLLS